jgi:hypothetical protein
MNDSQEHSYDFIFEKLAGEPDDLVGLLAYGIYKRGKMDFVKRFKPKNGCNVDQTKKRATPC